jgi:hypothetical protein
MSGRGRRRAAWTSGAEGGHGGGWKWPQAGEARVGMDKVGVGGE